MCSNRFVFIVPASFILEYLREIVLKSDFSYNDIRGEVEKEYVPLSGLVDEMFEQKNQKEDKIFWHDEALRFRGDWSSIFHCNV